MYNKLCDIWKVSRYVFTFQIAKIIISQEQRCYFWTGISSEGRNFSYLIITNI